MKIVFLAYHNVFEERIKSLMDEIGIDNYYEWEKVLGKMHAAAGHLGTRTFPGYDTVRMIPFIEEERLGKLIEKISDFNSHAVKKSDEIRLYALPLETVI